MFAAWGKATMQEEPNDAIEQRRSEALRDGRRLQRNRVEGGQQTQVDDKGERLSRVARKGSKDPFVGQLMAAAVRTWQPRRMLELGTGIGMSAAYMAVNLDSTSTLITVEREKSRTEYARSMFEALALDDRIQVVNDSFTAALRTLNGDDLPFDIVFIDGHHQTKATLKYLTMLGGHIRKGGLIVIDDIGADGMVGAWTSLLENDSYEGVALVDMGALRVIR